MVPPFALLLSLSLALATTVALGTGLNQFLIQMGGLATAKPAGRLSVKLIPVSVLFPAGLEMVT